MNNKKIIIFSAIGAIVLVAGAILILSSGKKNAPVEVAQVPQEEKITVIEPEEIGLNLTASANNREVILEVSNTGDISGMDYELSYISKGDIPRGVIGHIDVKVAGKPVRQEITLGTCSDVCHYDEDVSDIKLIVKLLKTDGSTASIQKSLELEQ